MNAEIHTSWTTARLVEPSTNGFLFVGISSGRWPIPPAVPSKRRRAALGRLHRLRALFATVDGVRRADVFRATLVPPGTSRGFEGQYADRAVYDAVLLVETGSVDDAAALAAHPAVTALGEEFPTRLTFAARNVRRIGPVDHERPGVFLFNYFTADDVAGNLHAWQYTAGWFQDETALDNSTVLEPLDGASFTVVNHCRWDHYRDIVPALVTRRSFRTFVLRTFADHRVAPRPVLYALDRSRRTPARPTVDGATPERRARG
ncbi:hypothetical protein GCM10017608_34590 [Agromyces luteolus]|uniref:Uncharacterized protein n=1 Tax=Agromyces luteolus TaxID=88373 RepID=A0A7C9MIW1_9MICO|nr:hypothetical protein [Agromyces luteolus]MUN08198.1 hypothetical protein [Agromyces luteolus]GLK29521.1 hypothetical protein GCM10017608_34590 [Agromyces luteolus]